MLNKRSRLVQAIFHPPGCYWFIGGAALGSILILAAIASGPLNRAREGREFPEPVLEIIAYSTATPIRPTSPAGTLSPASTPTGVAREDSDKMFRLSDYVEVVGTGGEGLRLRGSPSLEASINAMGVEHEVFEVRDGPREADGYRWWYLVNPYDRSKQGWAVANYLQILHSP